MSGGEPILLVEPDTRIALMIARYLAGHGFDATIVSTHSEIFDELTRTRYACVLLDVTSETESTCKLLCDGLAIPIVPLSGRSERRISLFPTRYSLSELLAEIQKTIQPPQTGE